MIDETLPEDEEDSELVEVPDLIIYIPETQEEKRRLWCLEFAGIHAPPTIKDLLAYAEYCEAFLIDGTIKVIRSVK